MYKRFKYLLIFVLLAVTQMAYSQCAMCKAVAESDLNGGGATAVGLNNGIMYLMAFPYVLIASVAYLWYRQKKLNKA